MQETNSPKCAVLLYQPIWGWLYEKLIPRMRERYGTRFIILATSKTAGHLKSSLCSPADEVLDMEALEMSFAGEPVDIAATMMRGAENEIRYNVSYMRDLVQQIRTISAHYFTHAPMGLHATSEVDSHDSWASVVNRLNKFFDYFDHMLADRGVDLVICRPDLGFATLTCVHAAAARGIPVTFAKGVRYRDYLSWACGPYAESDYLAATYETIAERGVTPREELLPPGGSDLRWLQAKLRYSVRNTVREILVQTATHAQFRFGDLRKWRWATHRLSYHAAVRQLLYFWRVGRWMDRVGEASIEKIASQPYVLFLLPQEPEFTIQSLCREFPHTFTVAQQLAMSLPPGVRLVIKEHALLTGRRLSFYQDLLRMPNVVLAHRLMSGIDLADRCAAVATMSGTTGIEATLLGKQVVLIGKHVEYGFLPNIQRVGSFDALPEILRGALRPRSSAEIDAVRRAGSRYRDAVAAVSYSAPGTPPLNGTRTAITAEELDGALTALLGNFRFQGRRLGVQRIAAQ